MLMAVWLIKDDILTATKTQRGIKNELRPTDF